MSRAPRVRRLLRASNANVITIAADGNCLYSALSKATGSHECLRDIVASKISANELEFYKTLHSAGVAGYDQCAQCTNLSELQNILRLPKIVWADQFAIETLVLHFKLHLWVLDDGAARDKFVLIGGQKIVQKDDDIVLLHRTRRQHYNLITIGGKCLLRWADVPAETRVLFGAELAVVGMATPKRKREEEEDGSKGEVIEKIKYEG